MSARAVYRAFLKSEFWKELSGRKKASVGECERCGNVERLQCHHKVYRSDWYDTEEEDLEVLCSRCHKEEHGIRPRRRWGGIEIFRDDVRFSKFIHWTGYLQQRMCRLGKNGRLKGRELWYLQRAVEMYPPEPKDSCMEFHVDQCRKRNELAKDWP